MKSRGNIVFLGMMGSGKTSIGKLVSKTLRLNFFDTDQVIEKNLGIKVSKIFATKGEKYFRDIEEKTTLNLLSKKRIVLALGGGTFVNKRVRKEILQNHISFWLDLNSETIITRVSNSNKRPLVLNSTKKELLDLIKKRSIIYSKALYKINCENFTKKEIVSKIVSICEGKKINN